jgi:hypothetical protein
MTPQQNMFLILKLAIVFAFVMGVFVLTGMGKIDSTAAVAAITAGVGSLVVALGISGSGASQAAATRAVGGAEPPNKNGPGNLTTTTIAVTKSESHPSDPATLPVIVPAVPRSTPPPPRSMLVPGAMLAIACACVVAGCALFGASAAKQAQDVASEIACVQTHWGEPILQLAAACTGSSLSLAEDVVADVELLLEKSTDAGVAASFPYRDSASVMGKVASKRAGSK